MTGGCARVPIWTLQSAIQSMSMSAGFRSEAIVWHIEAEESLIQRRAEQGLHGAPAVTATTTIIPKTGTHRSPPVLTANA
jgi:hypothetical protein